MIVGQKNDCWNDCCLFCSFCFVKGSFHFFVGSSDPWVWTNVLLKTRGVNSPSVKSVVLKEVRSIAESSSCTIVPTRNNWITHSKSPPWRSLSLWRGYLTIPKKVTKNCQVTLSPIITVSWKTTPLTKGTYYWRDPFVTEPWVWEFKGSFLLPHQSPLFVSSQQRSNDPTSRGRLSFSGSKVRMI